MKLSRAPVNVQMSNTFNKPFSPNSELSRSKNQPFQTMKQDDPNDVQGGQAEQSKDDAKSQDKFSMHFTAVTQGKLSVNFTKINQDMQIELDIYQRHIYYHQVEKDGTKPYLNLIVDNMLDIEKLR